MIKAILDSAFRLVTFRHNGLGIHQPSMKLLALCVIASSALAYARWGLPIQASAHALLIILIAAVIHPSYAIGYALLSAGIDLLAIPVEMAAGGEVRAFFWWELLAASYFFYRNAKRRGGYSIQKG